MGRQFSSFVILADMRTGSNALEEKLNSFPGLTSHGEVFNPHFVGQVKADALFGVTMTERETDPQMMLDALKANTEGLAGFRLFSDHDPRALDLCLKDRGCAKIILTRNPADSYVSLKIARKTGQWWLGDLKTAKSAKIVFDEAEFAEYAAAQEAHLALIHHKLQVSGQTAFHIAYDALSDEAVISGLARYLGVTDAASAPGKQGKIQNPRPLKEKVTNYAAMQRYLDAQSRYDPEHQPSFEPSRGPNVPAFVTSDQARLLYLPIKSAADRQLRTWLGAMDGLEGEKPASGHTQKSLRQWKRGHVGHVTFTVISHPAVRIHDAFCRHILSDGADAYPAIQDILRKRYRVPLPVDPESDAYDIASHKQAFLAFLQFVRGNLGGQTSVRVDGSWATQSAMLQGFASFVIPELIIREDELAVGLQALCQRQGIDAPDLPKAVQFRHGLGSIYDAEIETAVRRAYQRDYMMFGFGAWDPKRV